MPKPLPTANQPIDASAIMALIPPDRTYNNDSRVRIRALWYLVISGILITIHALSLTYMRYQGTLELYLLLEIVTILLSVIVSVMALIKYRTRHLAKYLMIGFGFAATAALGILSLPHSLTPGVINRDIALTYWIRESMTLSIFVLLSILLWKYQSFMRSHRRILFLLVFITPCILIMIYLVPEYLSGVMLATTAMLFLVSTIGYVAKGYWMRKYFEHWFVIALFIFSYTEFIRLSSSGLFDAPMIASHVLKILAIAVTLTGLLKSMYIAFKQVEEAGNKINTILASVGEGVIVLDYLRRAVLMNPVAEALTGVTADDIQDKRFDEATHITSERGNHSLVKSIEQVLLEKRPVSYDHQILTRNDGKNIYVSYSVAPIVEHSDVLLGFAVVIHDSSHEHELEQTKDNFLSVVAHQLRTPLGAMRWNLELLLSNDFGVLTKKMIRPIEETYQNNHRMVNLVNDLLNVLRIDQRRVIDNPKPADLYEAVVTISSSFRFEALSRNISIEVKQDKKQPMPFVIDLERLTEIVENLISNAIKYNKDNGRVTISLSSSNQSYVIRVEDTGIGIPQKDQGNIFTRFFRATNARTNNTGGSGLGLFVVQSYVTGWGGSVLFESKEDIGTTIILSIPKKPRRLMPSALAKS